MFGEGEGTHREGCTNRGGGRREGVLKGVYVQGGCIKPKCNDLYYMYIICELVLAYTSNPLKGER